MPNKNSTLKIKSKAIQLLHLAVIFFFLIISVNTANADVLGQRTQTEAEKALLPLQITSLGL